MTRQFRPFASGRILLRGLLVLLVVGLPIRAFAQTTIIGNISGTVRDPSGAAVSKAEVTIQEERTGVTRKVTADENGFYSAPSLPVGRYTVTAAPTGFKKTVASGL